MPPYNEYDEMLTDDKGVVGNEYDSLVAADKSAQKSQLKQTMYVARKREPDRHAEVMRLSDKTKLPVEVVDRNYDIVKERDEVNNTDYDALIAQSPSLSRFLQNPDNASVAKDDTQALSKIETHAKRQMKSSFALDLGQATKSGMSQLEASAAHLALAYGKLDPDVAVELIAEANKRQQEIEAQKPDYAKEFDKIIGEEMGDVDKAWERFKGSYGEYKKGNILKALKDFGAGGALTVGETLDMIGEAASMPRGLMYSTVQNLPNALPAMALAAGGAKAGSLIGAPVGGAVGSVIPGAGTLGGIAVGAGVGAAGGAFAGAFAGSSATEIGSWINESLQRKGVDVTNAASLKQAYANHKLMAEIRAEAERKGFTTAGVDALFTMFAGKFLGNAGKGAKAKVIAGAKDIGVQSVGEAASEFAGQAAAYKDIGKASLGEAIQEGVISIGQSTVESVGGASIRAALPKDTTQAAEHLVVQTEKAKEAFTDAQNLQELGNAVKESKLSTRMPEKIKELVDMATEGREATSVFFQTDDFDSYWSKKGLSPAKAAEQIMNDGGKAYHEAKETGAPLEIPLGDYVSKVGPTEDFDGLLPVARTRPDGMTLEEAKEHSAALPTTMKELADEAQAPVPTEVTKEVDEARQITEAVAEQLKATGMSAKDAKIQADVLYGRVFKNLAERAGVSPKELFDKYGLKIGRPEMQGELATGETGFNQEQAGSQLSPLGFFSQVEQSVRDIDFKSMTEIPAQDFLNKLKNMPGVKKEEIETIGLSKFLQDKGKEKVTKDQVLNYIADNMIKVDQLLASDKIKSDDDGDVKHVSNIEWDEPERDHSSDSDDIYNEMQYYAEDYKGNLGEETYNKIEKETIDELKDENGEYDEGEFEKKLEKNLEAEAEKRATEYVESDDYSSARYEVSSNIRVNRGYAMLFGSDEMGWYSNATNEEYGYDLAEAKIKLTADLIDKGYVTGSTSDVLSVADVSFSPPRHDRDRAVIKRKATELFNKNKDAYISKAKEIFTPDKDATAEKNQFDLEQEAKYFAETDAENFYQDTSNKNNQVKFVLDIPSIDGYFIGNDKKGYVLNLDDADGETQKIELKAKSVADAKAEITEKLVELGRIGGTSKKTVQEINTPTQSTSFESYVEDGEYDNYRELKLTLPFGMPGKSQEKFVYSAHFRDPNILAHIRMDDRTLADGRKVLFLEEIQSDWHQQGRKRGYKDEAYQKNLQAMRDERNKLEGEQETNIKEMNSAIKSAVDSNFNFFKPDEWPELARKKTELEKSSLELKDIKSKISELQDEAYNLRLLDREYNALSTWLKSYDGEIPIKAIEGRYYSSKDEMRLSLYTADDKRHHAIADLDLPKKDAEKLLGADLINKLIEQREKGLEPKLFNTDNGERLSISEKTKNEFISKANDISNRYNQIGLEVDALDKQLGAIRNKVDGLHTDGKAIDDLRGLFVGNDTSIDSDTIRSYERLDYALNKEANPALFQQIEKTIGNTKRRFEITETLSEMDRPVPDAPFKEEAWLELAIKRVIRYATEMGYENIAWTSGEQQVDRYAGSVEKLDWISYDKETQTLTGVDESGREITQKVQQSNLADFIGIEAAKRVNEKESKAKISGEELGKTIRLGGEHLRLQYDRKMPSVFSKIGKKYEAKPSVGGIEVNGTSQPVHVFKITDALKDTALNKGFAYFQDGAKGRIRFGGDRQFNIELLKNADPSTFIHETGHFYLEILGDLAEAEGASQQVKDDYATLLKWFGVEGRGQVTTEHHEQFARGFEAYLMEGKAPSFELRKAFARFKAWLVSVYRELKNLRVELTDDVRSVFDRLVAADAEIEAAQQEMNYEPMFNLSGPLPMNQEKAQAYYDALEEAREFADTQVSNRLMDDYMKAKEQHYKETRRQVRQSVEADVNNQNFYKALSNLQKGTQTDGSPLPDGTAAVKLDRAALVKDYGADFVKNKLPKPYVYAREGGLHHNVVAELYGFESGDAFIQLLANMPPRKDMIEQLTDQRMKEIYPDLIDDGPQLTAEAIDAVHNDAHAKKLRMELEHLASNNMPVLKDVIRRLTARVPTDKYVKEQAKRIIGSTRVGDLKPHKFRLAEAKYAKLAGQNLAKGDIEAAFEAKRKEYFNFELYRAAEEARRDVEATAKNYKKMFRRSDEDMAKSRDMNFVNAAKSVLAAYGIGRDDRPPSSYLEQMAAYDPDGYNTIKSLVDMATESAGFYKTVNYDTFLTMKESVNALWDLSKTSREIEIDGVKMDKEVVKGELMARLTEVTSSPWKAGYNKAMTKLEKAQMYLMGAKAALTRVESWANTVDNGRGVFTKYFVQPIVEAANKYRVEKRSAVEKYLELVKKVEPSLTQQDIAAPEINYTFKGKQELLGALLHIGNQSNLYKLLVGRQWGEALEGGGVDQTRFYNFLNRAFADGTITKTDMDFVQSIWDMLETFKSPAQQVHKQMYGFYFNEITADTVITPFGEYRGGYVPAVADPSISADANIRNEKEALEKNNNSFMFPTSGRGFTKSRVETYAAPLSIDLSLVPAHIDKVLRFIHLEPRVKDVSRIVFDKEFRNTLNNFDPTIAGDMLVPWLQRAAQQKVVLPSSGWGWRGADATFKQIRSRIGLNTMTANITNALQQPAGLAIATLKVKPRYIRNSLWQYVHAPRKTAEMVAAKSSFMNTRTSAQAGEILNHIDDLLLNPSKYEKLRDFGKKHGYFFQSATQNFVDVVVWSGAYDQAVENGLNEIEAVREADAAVRTTQGTGHAEDISRFEVGTPFQRLFTMFYSYFNMQANILGSEFQKTIREMGLKKGAGRMLYIYTFGFMIPAIYAEAIVRAMSGKGLDEDDDDEYLDDAMSIFFGSQFRTVTAMAPGVGPLANSAWGSFTDKPYDDRITTSPAISNLESAIKAPAEVYSAISENGNKNKAVKDSLTLLGLLTGLPLAPLAKPISYGLDVSSGKAEPTGPIDFTRGLITGKAGQQ